MLQQAVQNHNGRKKNFSTSYDRKKLSLSSYWNVDFLMHQHEYLAVDYGYCCTNIFDIRLNDYIRWWLSISRNKEWRKNFQVKSAIKTILHTVEILEVLMINVWKNEYNPVSKLFSKLFKRKRKRTDMGDYLKNDLIYNCLLKILVMNSASTYGSQIPFTISLKYIQYLFGRPEMLKMH